MVFMFENSNKTIEKKIEHKIKKVIEIVTYDASHKIVSQGTGFFVKNVTRPNRNSIFVVRGNIKGLKNMFLYQTQGQIS